MSFKPTLKKIELCLTYRCNVRCNNCSNLCTQAPCPDGDLPVSSVKKFIDESVQSCHKWDLITLHGGEPILHREIDEICLMLCRYKEKNNHGVVLSLLSNGCCDRTMERLFELQRKYGVVPGVSEKVSSNRSKDGTPRPYIPINESPVDLGIPSTMGCFQTQDCGICLNYLGYFECSPAAAAARVFGWKPLANTVGELSVDRLSSRFHEVCVHCGFSMPFRRRVIEQTTSPTWEKAFERYNNGR